MGGLIATKLPLEKVSRFLRHNRLESTMVYLNISINDLKRAIIRIDNDDYIKMYNFVRNS